MVNARFDGDAVSFSRQPSTLASRSSTDRGLLVPVLRDVQTKSLRQIAAESAALIEKARTGRVTVDELPVGTFTITNLGMYEIDAFTPIINLPVKVRDLASGGSCPSRSWWTWRPSGSRSGRWCS